MTPPQPQPAQQHCDHECVCEWWRGNPSREPCCPVGSKCEHDTRTHPHTSQPVPEKCCIGLTYEQCQEVSEREKAATRNAESLRWATALNTLIATESVRLSPAMVNMVYSYRIAQIIESLRTSTPSPEDTGKGGE